MQHIIYLFRSTTQWCRVHTQSTLICEAEKKKKKKFYTALQKNHIYTLIAQVVKQAITKKQSGQKVNSNQ